MRGGIIKWSVLGLIIPMDFSGFALTLSSRVAKKGWCLVIGKPYRYLVDPDEDFYRSVDSIYFLVCLFFLGVGNTVLTDGGPHTFQASKWPRLGHVCYAQLHTHACLCRYPLTHAYSHACMHADTHSPMHTRMHACTHACMHADTHSPVHTRMHADTHVAPASSFGCYSRSRLWVLTFRWVVGTLPKP